MKVDKARLRELPIIIEHFSHQPIQPRPPLDFVFHDGTCTTSIRPQTKFFAPYLARAFSIDTASDPPNIPVTDLSRFSSSS